MESLVYYLCILHVDLDSIRHNVNSCTDSSILEYKSVVQKDKYGGQYHSDVLSYSVVFTGDIEWYFVLPSNIH